MVPFATVHLRGGFGPANYTICSSRVLGFITRKAIDFEGIPNNVFPSVAPIKIKPLYTATLFRRRYDSHTLALAGTAD